MDFFGYGSDNFYYFSDQITDKLDILLSVCNPTTQTTTGEASSYLKFDKKLEKKRILYSHNRRRPVCQRQFYFW
jgi:hypothetical protein